MFSFRHAAIAAAVLINCMTSPAFAQEQNVATRVKEFRMKLGATRIIYNPDASGAALAVNNPQDYPILVQGKVFAEDKKTAAPFIITPPLFRLEAGQQNRLRIIRTGGNFTPDRESLQWVCVGGVPPKNTDIWAQDKNGNSATAATALLNLEVSLTSCIKLFVRPSGLKGTPEDAAASLTWRREGDKISVHNPSPFYMNLASVTVSGKTVKGVEYIAPFADRQFMLPQGASGQVQWTVITDVGGESRPFISTERL